MSGSGVAGSRPAVCVNVDKVNACDYNEHRYSKEHEMKYAQFIKALRDKGVKVTDCTRHLRLSYGTKVDHLARYPSHDYDPKLLRQIMKKLGVPNP